MWLKVLEKFVSGLGDQICQTCLRSIVCFFKLNCKTSWCLVRLEMRLQILPSFITLFSRRPTLKVGQREKLFSSLVSDSCSSGTVPRIHFQISDLTSAEPPFVYIPKVARYGCD